MNQETEAYEQIKDIAILDKPFTIESGELTPTLKLRRKIIEGKYSAIIDQLYKK